MNEDEIIEKRITNLISVRQLIVSILIVMSSGLVGLFFTQMNAFKSLFIVMGSYGILILSKEFVNTNREIRSYLYKRRR